MPDLKQIIELLKTAPLTDIRNFLRILFLKQKFAAIGCLSLFFISVVLVVLYIDRSREYETIVTNTLQANLESTPQKYKGLEAFIMSNVKQGVDEDLKKHQMSKEFIAQFEALNEKLKTFPFKKEAEEPELYVVPGVSGGELLMDYYDNIPGFLYFPIHLLHTNFSSDELQRLDSEAKGNNPNQRRRVSTNQANDIEKYRIGIDSVRQKIAKDDALKHDIELTKYLAQELQAFTKNSITDTPDKNSSSEADNYLESFSPQVYIITKNGINRIFNNKTDHPYDYYGRQFPPTIFFPNRPYFWMAFKEKKVSDYQIGGEKKDISPSPNQTVGDYFYVSRPYMDLGGNGIVITLARGLKIDGFTQAVICFDLPFTQNHGIQSTLRERMNAFQGEDKSVEVQCKVSPKGGNVICTSTAPAEVNLNDTQKKLEDDIVRYIKGKNSGGELSEVFGNIQVINKGEGSIQFSVPVAPATYDAESQTATFLLSDINLIEYSARTFYIGISAATAFGLMTVWLAYLWGTTSRHRQEYQAALVRVSQVMSESSEPFVWLDENDHIRDVNKAFCTTLGYEFDEKTMHELRQHTFESLCADKESEEEYKRVQARRKSEIDVEPYQLNLKHASNRSHVHVRVVSAAIPSEKRGILPETFGILSEDVANDETGKIVHINKA
jgi:PAS domain S-box-containing protein